MFSVEIFDISKGPLHQPKESDRLLRVSLSGGEMISEDKLEKVHLFRFVVLTPKKTQIVRLRDAEILGQDLQNFLRQNCKIFIPQGLEIYENFKTECRF